MAKSKKHSNLTTMKYVKGKLREQAIKNGTYLLNKSVVMKEKKKALSKEACRKFKGNEGEE